MAFLVQNRPHAKARIKETAIALLLLPMLIPLNTIILILLLTKYLVSKTKAMPLVVPQTLQKPIHFGLPEQKFPILQVRVQIAGI